MNSHILNKKIIRLEKQNIDYNYTFLDEYKIYVDTKYIYESLQYINLKNCINYIYLKYILLKKEIEIDNKILKIYKCDSKLFNKILNEFINKEYSICIFVINCIIRYSS